MMAICLLMFSICIGTILLSIHHQDEIHRLVAWLLGLIGLICIVIITPVFIKFFIGLFFLLLRPTKRLTDNTILKIE
jgi:hypothetical protein